MFLALEVATKSSQLAVGLDFSDVIISIESPLLNFLDSGTNLPFTLAPLVLVPISVWMLNAKSKAVEFCGKDFSSPVGVKTKISSEYRFNLKFSTKSKAFESLDSSNSLRRFNQFSRPFS